MTEKQRTSRWNCSNLIYFVFGVMLSASVFVTFGTIQQATTYQQIEREGEFAKNEGRLAKNETKPTATANDDRGNSSFEYVPAPVERYILDHAVDLGYASDANPPGCDIWKDPNASTPEIHGNLTAYGGEIERYQALVREFRPPVPDLREEILRSGNHDVCARTRLHPDGLRGLFPSGQLSLTKAGYVEPLTTPMRSHKFCWKHSTLMGLDYLLHDFEVMCRRLKPTSKLILIDMGASLDFHQADQPIVALMELYEKFGFVFDHIYAFEIKFSQPKEVYEKLLPSKYLASYHWINVAVDPTEGAKMNPLHSILTAFNEDDFIVVKLDVDTPSVELPLAKQMLNNEVYHKLVDQFYFEHHVHLGEIARNWGSSMNGTIQDSMELFSGLRKKGVPAHFWP